MSEPSKIDHSNVSQEDIERASRSIKAMSHPLRLKILCILGDSEFSVQDIVDTVGTSQSNISQHGLTTTQISACSEVASGCGERSVTGLPS